jgi:hypothetical protein
MAPHSARSKLSRWSSRESQRGGAGGVGVVPWIV